MRTLAARLVSYRNFKKFNQFIRLKCVSADAHLSSDSGSDEAHLNLHLSDDENFECTQKGVALYDEFLYLDTNTVTRFLESLWESPRLALSYFYKFKEHGFQHNFCTYLAIVKVLSYKGFVRSLDTVLLEVIELSECGELDFGFWDLFDELSKDFKDKKPELLVRAVDKLVKLYVSRGRYDEAINTIFGTNRRGCIPSVSTCNYLLNRLVGSHETDRVVSVYLQLKKLGFTPNIYTYCIVIKAMCREGELENAIRVITEMAEAGVDPDVYVYTTYIEGICSQGRSDAGYCLLKLHRSAKIPFDVYAYFVVIRGFVSEMKLKEAESVLIDMEETGIAPDANCYEALIKGYCEAGNCIKSLTLHDEMLKKGIKSNCFIASSLLRCLSRMGSKFNSEVVDQFMYFKDLGIFLDGVVYNIAIDALGKLKKLEDAMKLFEEMKRKKIVPDIVHYTTLINHFLLNGEYAKACDILKEVKAEGLNLDIIVYDVLARGLSVSGHSQEALDLLIYMRDEGLKPTTVTHNMIIEGLCIAGKVKEAEKYFDSLEDKELDNYSAMVDGYCKAKKTKTAYEFFIESSEEGIIVKRGACLRLLSSLCKDGELDLAVKLFKCILASNDGPCKRMCDTLITALCHAGHMNKAKGIFDTMIIIGLPPDVITYTIMLNGYCKVNLLHTALDLFVDMKRRGIKPNIITYTVMIHGYSIADLQMANDLSSEDEKKDKRDGALTIWREMMSMELDPDVKCYTALLYNFCKSDDIQSALNVLDEMFSRGLKPDTVTYTALLSGYFRQGDINGALNYADMLAAGGEKLSPLYMSKLERIRSKAKK